VWRSTPDDLVAPAAKDRRRDEEEAMPETVRARLDDLWTRDRARQNDAFSAVMAATAVPVPWAYEVWDDAVANLTHRDNKNRAIAAQLLCNLAKSDPEDRILDALGELFTLTKDERFVTARHCLQSLWKVAVTGERRRDAVVDGLVRRFEECAEEKNGTLIRYDIVVALRKVYDAAPDEQLRDAATRLFEMEESPKYRKKYASAWREKRPAAQ
jgi:hypothetical protein